MDPESRPARPARRLRRALCWLAPSAVCACVGAVVAGLAEGSHVESLAGALAAAGFVALLAAPVVVVGSAVVRGLAAAWRPAELVARLIEPDGPAPRLAGWIAVAWIGGAGLAFAMFQSVWLIYAFTAFKPVTMSFLEPMVALATALVIAVLSRPCARLFAWTAGRLDARWRRRGHATLLRPRAIAAAAAAATIAAGSALWWLVMKPRLGPVDTSLLHAPAAGLAAAGALHAGWSRLGRARRWLGAGSAAGLAALIATALVTAQTQPSLTLELWGDRPLAGIAIEMLYPLEGLRAEIPLAEFQPAARPGAAHPDIVLITIDTVRADHTPPYGGQAAMPALRGLAARGAVFEWAFAPSNVTRRSIPSMVTGVAPDRVRGRVVGWALRLDPRHVLLAERLRAGGYDTAGFMCCEGFWGAEFHTGFERGLAHLEIEHHGPTLASKARAWIEARDQRAGRPPVFLWMHILEPHNWTQGAGEPRSDADRAAIYDRTLAASDQMVQAVLAAFDHRAEGHGPIVIVTADHGEALGEHGQPYHSTDLYDSQIRVPLVIAGPGIAARRIAETVSLTDLVPTVIDLAGFVPPSGASVDGVSIAALATGARAANPELGDAFAAMIKDRSNPGGIAAAIVGRWKLIDNAGNLELYDTRADPDEHNNVLGQHPREVELLRKRLDARTAARATSPFHDR